MSGDREPPSIRSMMDRRYCCLTCSATFRFGEIIGADVARCPTCASPNIHPAGGETVTLDAYHGEIGPKQ